jgi:hypothetical protein
MTKIYALSQEPSEYAQAGELKPWARGSDRCPVCGLWSSREWAPIKLYWEPGSERVGDFVWPYLDRDLVVQEHVADTLKLFAGFEVRPIEFVENPQKRLPKRPPRVTLPYEGPPLSELWITTWADIDRGLTTAELLSRCDACGKEKWKYSPWVGSFTEQPMGVPVSAGQLVGAGLFRVRQFSGWSLCTEPVRDAIVEAGFTNVYLTEVGKVVE